MQKHRYCSTPRKTKFNGKRNPVTGSKNNSSWYLSSQEIIRDFSSRHSPH